MKLGIALPHYDISFPDQQPATFDRIARYAELAESLGFHQAWVSDHFWLNLEQYGGPAGRQGTPECWTTLSTLAVRTSRVRLGSLVLAAGFRPPRCWPRWPPPSTSSPAGGSTSASGPAGTRPSSSRTGCRSRARGAAGHARGGPGGAAGAAHRRGDPGVVQRPLLPGHQAPVVPGPVQPRPPLWVGGGGDRLLGVVARAADGWNCCWAITSEDYRRKVGVLAGACQRAGRDPGGAARWG